MVHQAMKLVRNNGTITHFGYSTLYNNIIIIAVMIVSFIFNSLIRVGRNFLPLSSTTRAYAKKEAWH